ncbi:MAG: hypothetical protein HYY24_03140, partial [Verrucomicrobia bacterium]|nr:hypothetical protein [Verrucomicrobiota bacterium]
MFSGWDPGAPIILCHPETQVVLQGTSVTFTVQADHAQPGLPGTFTYQWQINKGPNATNFTNIDGETSASYTIDQTTTNHVALYRVLVSGSGTAISHPACLQVYVPGNSFTVFGTPLLSSGGGGTTCPGSYVGYVNYKKSIAEGWG